MKCLLVDDEPGIREGLAALLRRQGHHIDTAADCASAQRALASGAFDVVISDWRLPDGFASTFVAGCTCPVIAVSGHPDEVENVAPIRAVLGKPVSPAVLARTIVAVATPQVAAPCAPLPCDVRAVIHEFTAQLPAATPVHVDDDGTFVILQADVPADAPPRVRAAGGDLRLLRRDGRCTYELRLCRDGRPAPDVPVVRAGAGWPAVAELAVDFHDTTLGPPQIAECLDRARAAAAGGRRIHFLNVPEALRSAVASQGRAHDMPMREPVGPRVQPDFADLWSLP